MYKINKIFILLLISLISVFILTGCFNSDKISELKDGAKESAIKKSKLNNTTISISKSILNSMNTTSAIELINTDNFKVNSSQIRGGIEIVNAGLLKNIKCINGKKPHIVSLGLNIHNTSHQPLNIFPDQGFIITNTGEQIKADMSNSDSVGGVIHPNVIKDGVVTFPINLTKINEINNIKYIVKSPINESLEAIDNDYIFNIELNNENYKEVKKSEIIKRAYQHSQELVSNKKFNKSKHIELVESIGPIRFHIIDIYFLSNFSASNNEPMDALCINIAIENTSDEVINFYANQGVLVTNTKEQLIPYMFYSDYIDGTFYAHTVKLGSFCFKLNRSKIDDISKITYIINSPINSKTLHSLSKSKSINIKIK